MSKQTRWFLVSSCGVTIPLRQTMISLGKEGCDVVLQSRSVDQRHALVTYDHYEKRFKVKDLNSINGTYLNEVRIPSQTFVKLEHLDSLRFGFDASVYQVQVVEQVPIPITSDYRFRNWEVGPYSYHPMKMADCQACLHKQAIPHTCGMKNTEWSSNSSQPAARIRTENTGLDPTRIQGSNQASKQDYCGNIVPPHLAGWTTTATPAAQQTIAGNLLLENGQCCHHQNAVTSQGNYPAPYLPSPNSQMHSTPQYPYTCCSVQNAYRPSAPLQSVTPCTVHSSMVGLGNSPTTLPISTQRGTLSFNDSKMVVGSGNNSLQSTFSGDSLDLTHEDAVVSVQKKDMGRAPPSNGHISASEKCGSIVENGPPASKVEPKCVTTYADNTNTDPGRKPNMDINESASKDIMVAEKPYTSILEHHQEDEKAVEVKDGRPSTVNRGEDSLDCAVVRDGSEISALDKSSVRPSCMAFTIEFDDDRPSSASSSTKKMDIKDGISKFAPPKPLESEPKIGHRRNLSIPKSKFTKKRMEGEGIADKLDSPTMGVMAAAKARLTMPIRGKAGQGYHSEGHVSSDQDDDASAKSDPAKLADEMDIEHLKVNGLPCKLSKRESPTKKGKGRRSLPIAGLCDSAKYLINKMFGEVQAPTNSPTDPLSPSTLLASCREKGKMQRGGPSADVPVSTPLTKNETKSGSRGSLVSNTTYTVDGREMDKSHHFPSTRYKPGEKDVQIREIVLSDEDDDGDDNDLIEEEGERGDAACSETGTYTIENDRGEAREETEARKNIDNVFGVTGNYNIQRPVVDADDNGDAAAVELRSTHRDYGQGRPLTISRKETPGWLKEWVALTASGNARQQQSSSSQPPPPELSCHTQSAQPNPSIGVNKALGCAPVVGSAGGVDGHRLRRKLPVPPVDRVSIGQLSSSSFSLPLTEKLNSLVDRIPDKPRASSSSTSPEGRRSDSSMDTETILKETETVVSAMEARMDHRRHNTMNVMGISVESRDSGGESDVDTSTASAANDPDGRYSAPALSKQSSTQLKAQLKLIEDGSRNLGIGRDCRTVAHSHGKNFMMREGTRSHGRTTPNSEYMDNSEVETASIHSDVSSSSDLSGSSPGSKRKGDDKPPVMRFNRAFSLRRARLGCDSDGSVHSAPISKTQPTSAQPSSRPGSAGSVGSSRDRARRSSTSNRSDSGASASSVPPGKGPPSAASNAAFSRTDGGRFSLRLPRGPPVLGKSTAKNQTSNQTSSGSRSKTANGPPTKAPPTSRSNSTLSAKELEMKNWKRRKGYDPLKAAAEGRKKEAAKKAGLNVSMSKSESLSPTSGSFQRSASFHGTDGLVQLRRNTFTSEDDMALDMEEGTRPSSVGYQRPALSDGLGSACDADIGLRCRIRKSSEDDSASEATRAYSHTDLTMETTSTSPRGSPLLHPVHRHKSKIEALDNLVISTVHQVSCNLRGNAEGILRKLGEVHCDECYQSFGADGLQDLISRVSNAESPVLSPPGRSVSRQLSGILKNMKRLEESLQAIDKVLDVIPLARDCATKKGNADKDSKERPLTSNSTAMQNKWNGLKRS